MSKTLRENIIYIMVAHAFFLTTPTIVQAETNPYNPINFTQPLTVSRGRVSPVGEDGVYLNAKETCELAVSNWGWERNSCKDIDQLIFAPNELIDNVVFEKPTSEGFVKFDDWKGKDSKSEVNEITEGYKAGLKEQSKRLGIPITFDGWLVYPTLDEKRHILYYANIIDWNGDKTVAISISFFDRYGYVPVQVAAADSNLPAEKVQEIVASVAEMYKPETGKTYAEFKSGDKVAAYGAVGVLATLLGVKYGKAASAGIFAMALLFLKKLWFLLLLPFIYLKRLFTRKDNE